VTKPPIPADDVERRLLEECLHLLQSGRTITDLHRIIDAVARSPSRAAAAEGPPPMSAHDLLPIGVIAAALQVANWTVGGYLSEDNCRECVEAALETHDVDTASAAVVEQIGNAIASRVRAHDADALQALEQHAWNLRRYLGDGAAEKLEAELRLAFSWLSEGT
jgi:hypothetical protein